ncbi:MAG: hypothetical protein JNM93_11535 [Bacteriovoracaceae bacterium]|nr:hypothetical protein [Bacteriovoracaceae bacterium]
MPMIGRAPTEQQSQLQNVRKGGARPEKQDPTAAVDQNKSYDNKLVNNLTGFREKSIIKEGPHNQMGKDEFLKLLSHQLKHQDPMNPMDQSKFSGELAQFAQLEQLANMNSKFDKMNSNVAVEDKFYGASFLGKKVVTTGNTVQYKGQGEKAEFYFQLPSDAEKVVVRLLDAKGNIVHEDWKEKLYSGQHKSSWDGYDLAGRPEKAGEYQVAVMAWDKTGGKLNVQTKNEGIVESIFFEGGEMMFVVNGKKTSLRDIDSFHMPHVEKTALQPEPTASSPEEIAAAVEAAGGTNAIEPSASNNAPRMQAINAYKNNAPLESAETSVYDE